MSSQIPNKILVFSISQQLCSQSDTRSYSFRNQAVQHVRPIKTSLTLSLIKATEHPLLLLSGYCSHSQRRHYIVALQASKGNKQASGCGQFTTLLLSSVKVCRRLKWSLSILSMFDSLPFTMCSFFTNWGGV